MKWKSHVNNAGEILDSEILDMAGRKEVSQLAEWKFQAK